MNSDLKLISIFACLLGVCAISHADQERDDQVRQAALQQSVQDGFSNCVAMQLPAPNAMGLRAGSWNVPLMNCEDAQGQLMTEPLKYQVEVFIVDNQVKISTKSQYSCADAPQKAYAALWKVENPYGGAPPSLTILTRTSQSLIQTDPNEISTYNTATVPADPHVIPVHAPLSANPTSLETFTTQLKDPRTGALNPGPTFKYKTGGWPECDLSSFVYPESGK